MSGSTRLDVLMAERGIAESRSRAQALIMAGRVLVEGVNFIWKHLRRSQQHPHGARIQKEASLHVSNVRIVCQSCNKPTRAVSKKLEDGDKARICKKCRQAVAPEV